ncbi:MAG: Nif3-like dinuclear metal center hexameric protein [Bacteroidetes bacterium]|nr:MAG: Nif3-like dinuclear metal center hexameric protein [Bacteroidota bacterium]
MTVREIAAALDVWAPAQAAESYDNVGLLAGDPDAEVRGVLINLDVTEAVVEEAASKGLNLIITHHPIWFGARKRITTQDYVGRILLKAIQKGVHLYAIHTNLDNIRTGVNLRMAERLGLGELDFLRPNATNAALGSGMIGFLPEVMEADAFLLRVKEAFRCGGIRYAAGPQKQIHRVAICGGAGSFLTPEAIAAGADAFITADITYHKFFDSEDKLFLLDIGHYESEQFTPALICEYLSEKFPTFALHLSETLTNPVQYI